VIWRGIFDLERADLRFGEGEPDRRLCPQSQGNIINVFILIIVQGAFQYFFVVDCFSLVSIIQCHDYICFALLSYFLKIHNLHELNIRDKYLFPYNNFFNMIFMD